MVAYSSLMRLSAEISSPVRPASGRERERPGTDQRVIGDQLGRLEVALDALVLHELHVAEVGEALATDGVARGVDPDIDVGAGQIVNRVRVLGAGQTPYGDAARLAAVCLFVRLQRRRGSRSRRRRAPGRREVGRIERRHRAALEHVRHFLPVVDVSADRGSLEQALDAHAGFWFGRAVTLEAVLLKGARRRRRRLRTSGSGGGACPERSRGACPEPSRGGA